MVEIYVINLDEPINNEQIQNWLTCITEEEKQRIHSFRFFNDMKRSLYGNILIRYLICKRYLISNKDIIIEKNLNGKPFLKDYPLFKFNISHSGKWLICAISEKSIGIDIEMIKDINFNMAKRYFSMNEFQYINSKIGAEQLRIFYELWTLKESYIKYLGKGLWEQLKKVNFTIDMGRYILNDKNWSGSFWYSYFETNYILAVCSEEKEVNPIIKRQDMKAINIVK